MLDNKAIEQLWTNARTYNAWQDKPVSQELIHQLYELSKLAPTSANCSPARFVFLTSAEAKQRIQPAMAEGNVEKTMTAPVVAIIAYDTEFHNHLPFLFPHTDAKSWFAGNEAKIHATSHMNTTLQIAYLIMAARTLGLDCGPMGGFDNDAVNAEFFSDGKFKSVLICNIGYGSTENLFERSPRFEFDQVCKIL